MIIINCIIIIIRFNGFKKAKNVYYPKTLKGKISPEVTSGLNFITLSGKIRTNKDAKGFLMATIGMGDIKKGVRLEITGVPYKVVEFQHVKPGKGAAFVRCKVKSFLNGKVIEKTIHAGDKFEVPNLVHTTMQFLYDDGEMLQFMDNESYEQLGLTYDQCEDAMKWIKDGTNVQMIFHNGNAISVEAPEIMELKITETPPNFKGDTSSGSKKPATLETGAVVQVPYHVLEGDIIKVNTVEGEYMEKVK